MPKLTQAATERCANIASAIDAELQKSSSERKSLYIRTSNPKSLKAELAAYKTTFRQEWKQQFIMTVYDDRAKQKGTHPVYGRCIEVSFAMGGVKKVAYEILRDDEDTVEVYKEDTGLFTTSPFTSAPVTQLDDMATAQYILIEQPMNLKLDLSFLSTATLSYLDDDKNEPSALINMLNKRGYSIEKRGAFLWIFRGES